MSPTVCHNTDTEIEGSELSETGKNSNVLKTENSKRDPKDRNVDQQCAKRKLSNDESRLSNKKKKRRETENDTIISSLSSTLSSNSDDYGTDCELIAINRNKKKSKHSCRYVPLDTFQDFIEDTRSHLIAVSETNNLMCENNYTISIDERGITSSAMHVDDVFKKIITTTKISNANTKHLFDIAISTFKLVKKNQEFQLKLRELQTDTKNFITSIMENPENQSIKDQFKVLM